MVRVKGLLDELGSVASPGFEFIAWCQWNPACRRGRSSAPEFRLAAGMALGSLSSVALSSARLGGFYVLGGSAVWVGVDPVGLVACAMVM